MTTQDSPATREPPAGEVLVLYKVLALEWVRHLVPNHRMIRTGCFRYTFTIANNNQLAAVRFATLPIRGGAPHRPSSSATQPLSMQY